MFKGQIHYTAQIIVYFFLLFLQRNLMR